MGSVDGLINCPCCGMPARDTFFYHSSSYVTSCEFCGYLNYKMIWYEDCVPEDDPSLEDGYVIKHHDGHGVVIYRINNRFRSYDKKSDDERPFENMDVVLESFMKNGKLSKIVLHSGFDFTLPAVLCENNEGNYVFAAYDTEAMGPDRYDAEAMKRRFANPYNHIKTCPVEFVGCKPYVFSSRIYDDLSDMTYPPSDIRIYTVPYGFRMSFFTEGPVTYHNLYVPAGCADEFIDAVFGENVMSKDDIIYFCNENYDCHDDPVVMMPEYNFVHFESRPVLDNVSDYEFLRNNISKNKALDDYEEKCDYTDRVPDIKDTLKKYIANLSVDRCRY